MVLSERGWEQVGGGGGGGVVGTLGANMLETRLGREGKKRKVLFPRPLK